MCDTKVKVCRICLKSETRFYKFEEYGLKKCYEDVTALVVNKKDGLPQYFCYECAAMLHKFHLFKDKCIQGHKTLQEMLRNGPITYAGICDKDCKRLNKQSYPELEILTVNERCKTYYYVYKSEELKPYTIDVDCAVEESVGDLDYSEGPVSDDDNFGNNDPETDPVAEESSLALNIIKSENLPINLAGTAFKLEFEEPLQLDLNQVKLEAEQIEILTPHIVINQETDIKRKKVIKKTVRTKDQRTKKRGRQKVKSKKEEDSDSSEETLSSIKKKKASKITPDATKSYRFNKPKQGIKNLAFLDSGFWKKSSLTEEEAAEEFKAKAQDRKYLSAAYKCTDCYKGFSQKEMLDRHIPNRHGVKKTYRIDDDTKQKIVHLREKGYTITDIARELEVTAVGKMVCHFCKMRFKSLYFLNKHMRQHYTKYECLRCDLVCTLETSALFHEEYHNGVVRKCPHCDKEFKHLSTFYTHLRTHRSKHMCALCGESFVSELGLRLHRKSKHSHEDQRSRNGMEDNMYCGICKMKFETKEAYDKHLAHSAMHTDENMGSDDSIVANLLKDEADEDYDGSNKTEELLKRKSRVEKTLSAVRKSHLRRRTTKKPTTCHQCGKHYETQSACLKHHLSAHPGTSFFSPRERVICEICGASLAPGSVASHLNQHTRQKMYTCDTCGRSFTTSTMLRTHLVTHTGEKRFACNLCDKRFTQNGSLSLHHRTFHLKQPYPKRNRRKKLHAEGNGKEE